MIDEAIEAARRIEAQFDGRSVHTIDVGDIRLVARALLSREAERDAVIEECAKAADAHAPDEVVDEWDEGLQHAAEAISRDIRSLKGQPSADGEKEGTTRHARKEDGHEPE